MKKKILISAPYLQISLGQKVDGISYREMLEEDFELIIPTVDERLSEEELLDIFDRDPDISGAIVGDDYFTEKVYDSLWNTQFKTVVKWGTGIDSLNKEYAESVGITVRNTTSAFTIPVSESTIGIMLSFCRRIEESNDEMKKGIWSKVRGFTLNESKIGIIGLGNIGSEVAHKLEVFTKNISYYDPNVNNFKYNRYHDLDQMITDCDIITIHCDLNETSKHLINKDNLELLKGKILVNVSRGGLINNKDLENHISIYDDLFVGLDVFEEEPLPKDHPFRSNERIICSSHNTNTSPKYWNNVHINSIRMLKESVLD